MRLRSLLVIIPAVCLVVGLGSGAAFAYFTSSGHGTGSGSVGAMQTVTIVAPTGSVTTPLMPGGSGDVTLTVNNPNSFPVTLVSVTGHGTIAASGAGPGGCTTTGIVTFSDQTSLNKPIAANGTTSVDLPGAVSMTTGAAAGCQGATFLIPVTITVEK